MSEVITKIFGKQTLTATKTTDGYEIECDGTPIGFATDAKMLEGFWLHATQRALTNDPFRPMRSK